MCASALTACETTLEDAAPLGASSSQNGKARDEEERTFGPADFAGPAGGSNTLDLTGPMSFGTPSPAIAGADLQLHLAGREGFDQVFSLEELAPLWNNESCSGCHVNGGRSKLGSNPLIPQLLFRVSIPGTNPDGGPNPVPGIGDQIQPFIVKDGVRVVGEEGTVSTTYVEELRAFVDGQAYSLRKPTYTPSVSLPADVMISPRIGQQMAGLGLLEAVEARDILELADPTDRNNDGISGRPNMVWDVALQKEVLGRFGWKANQPNLLQQAAAAFNGDLGITSPLFPLESNVPGGGRNKRGPGIAMTTSGLSSLSTAAAILKDPSASSTVTDIDVDKLFATAFYTGTLAVPAARNANDPQVLRGQALFVAAKCAACHQPVLETVGNAPFGLGNQKIHPYTDLLLHDMGPGLADGRPDFKASGSEWRTAPLWGIGLSAITSRHTNYLHDGRARNVLEAIMWHGGEGDASRQYVEKLSQTDRDALVAFVNSL
ncbi:di-heme oxidoreductase family protein [Hymenobacter cellulosilyticus]|uniref:C-type cytochrome n=1 Tax=Hymenobacter cellulosilyticus TaxID=2932248 RepID=A0A8T9Q1D1_9BACT|nr:di-heme oxidoredictase family protein [Hymenobacter cellulosilyticus]UOQ71207.1 c-type cytochrome [Hymenobacter cellulosilyticus]